MYGNFDELRLALATLQPVEAGFIRWLDSGSKPPQRQPSPGCIEKGFVEVDAFGDAMLTPIGCAIGQARRHRPDHGGDPAH